MFISLYPFKESLYVIGLSIMVHLSYFRFPWDFEGWLSYHECNNSRLLPSLNKVFNLFIEVLNVVLDMILTGELMDVKINISWHTNIVKIFPESNTFKLFLDRSRISDFTFKLHSFLLLFRQLSKLCNILLYRNCNF